jgi:hypothetical protein
MIQLPFDLKTLVANITSKPLRMTPMASVLLNRGCRINWYGVINAAVSSNELACLSFSFWCRRSGSCGTPSACEPARKKTDAAKYPKAFHHVGLLVNEPSATRIALYLVIRKLRFKSSLEPWKFDRVHCCFFYHNYTRMK